MHYSVLVLTREKPTSAEDSHLAEVLEPYGDGREWDWWSVGGRWTGLFDGYDPETDPANVEVCTTCGGSGKRFDMVVQDSGCNGCDGTGKRVKWPTAWPYRAEDSIEAATLTAEHLEKFHAVCVEDYGWFGGERYEPWNEMGEQFVKQAMPPLGWLKERGGFATVVDCHN